jgi:hypothetical protein
VILRKVSENQWGVRDVTVKVITKRVVSKREG